jgi:hypothetical protein
MKLHVKDMVPHLIEVTELQSQREDANFNVQMDKLCNK